MIYDCFSYWDEDLLLDLRLNILDKFVDYFVIVESKFTHRGDGRNLNIDINKFSKFKNKIIYKVYDEIPSKIEEINDKDDESTKSGKYIMNAVYRENSQRNYISQGIKEAENNDIILDIGPTTVQKVKEIIKISKTVLWNGPAGYFENPNFAGGSYEIARAIVKKNKENSIYSVIGGGDTIALINQLNLIQDFNFVSTAGGAFLEYLEGKELPGIKALN